MSEYEKKADEIMRVLHDALSSVDPFYDCRMIFGLLLGIASVRAASLRQANVLSISEIEQHFAAALAGAFIDGKVPQVRIVGTEGGEVKQ